MGLLHTLLASEFTIPLASA